MTFSAASARADRGDQHGARATPRWGAVLDIWRGIAIGHAWAEVHDGQAWQRVDSTPVAVLDATYLILTELDDEGPAFGLAMMDLISIMLRNRIEVIATSAS